MQRRTFLSLTGAMGLHATDAPKESGFWLLENYYLKQGTQMARLHDWLKFTRLPAIQKLHTGPVIVMEALAAQHMPQVMVAIGFDPQPEWTSIMATDEENPRIFELRVYDSPSWNQLRDLHESKIFQRVGVRPIFHSLPLAGTDMPNLTYLVPFDNLASREKAWDAFSADAEWVKLQKEAAGKYGQISRVSRISIFKSAFYSLVR